MERGSGTFVIVHVEGEKMLIIRLRVLRQSDRYDADACRSVCCHKQKENMP